MDMTYEVYDELIAATRRAADANEELIEAQEALEDAAFGLRLAGKVAGKNETERQDSVRQQLPAEHLAIRAAQRTHRRATTALKLAELQVEQVRLEVRWSEYLLRSGIAYAAQRELLINDGDDA